MSDLVVVFLNKRLAWSLEEYACMLAGIPPLELTMQKYLKDESYKSLYKSYLRELQRAVSTETLKASRHPFNGNPLEYICLVEDFLKWAKAFGHSIYEKYTALYADEIAPDQTTLNKDTNASNRTRQQKRLSDLAEFIAFLKDSAQARGVEFDPLDLPLTKNRLFKELALRYPRFEKIGKEQFEKDWRAAKDKNPVICENQRATEKKGEIFLKAIFG